MRGRRDVARPPQRPYHRTMDALPGPSTSLSAPGQPVSLTAADDPFRDLTDTERRLALALAAGDRWRRAARAAGLTTRNAWLLFNHSKRLRDAIDIARASHLPLADDRLATLAAVMRRGRQADADPATLSAAVSAARLVGDALGISGRYDTAAARTRVAVAVTVAPSAPSASLRADPSIPPPAPLVAAGSAGVLDAEWAPVAPASAPPTVPPPVEPSGANRDRAQRPTPNSRRRRPA